MNSKLILCLALILSGLAVGGCLTSARLKSQSPAAAQAQFIYSTNAGGTTATITRYKGSSGAVEERVGFEPPASLSSTFPRKPQFAASGHNGGILQICRKRQLHVGANRITRPYLSRF